MNIPLTWILHGCYSCRSPAARNCFGYRQRTRTSLKLSSFDERRDSFKDRRSAAVSRFAYIKFCWLVPCIPVLSTVTSAVLGSGASEEILLLPRGLNRFHSHHPPPPLPSLSIPFCQSCYHMPTVSKNRYLYPMASTCIPIVLRSGASEGLLLLPGRRSRLHSHRRS